MADGSLEDWLGTEGESNEEEISSKYVTLERRVETPLPPVQLHSGVHLGGIRKCESPDEVVHPPIRRPTLHHLPVAWRPTLSPRENVIQRSQSFTWNWERPHLESPSSTKKEAAVQTLQSYRNNMCQPDLDEDKEQVNEGAESETTTVSRELVDLLSCDCEMDKGRNHRGPKHFCEHVASHVESILELLGVEDNNDLSATHKRVAKSLWAMTHGHRSDPYRHSETCEVAPGRGRFESPFMLQRSQRDVIPSSNLSSIAAGIVVVRRIAFTSLCEHHMLPFFGHVAICYVPHEVILGLSKFVRVVRGLSKMLQVQERLTVDVADTIMSLTDAKGVYVEIVAKHTCMMARGVEVSGDECEAITSCARGILESDWDCFNYARSMIKV